MIAHHISFDVREARRLQEARGHRRDASTQTHRGGERHAHCLELSTAELTDRSAFCRNPMAARSLAGEPRLASVSVCGFEGTVICCGGNPLVQDYSDEVTLCSPHHGWFVHGAVSKSHLSRRAGTTPGKNEQPATMSLHLPKHRWGTRGMDAYEKLECIGAGTYGYSSLPCGGVLVR
jgi:hypothetical protein